MTYDDIKHKFIYELTYDELIVAKEHLIRRRNVEIELLNTIKSQDNILDYTLNILTVNHSITSINDSLQTIERYINRRKPLDWVMKF